MNRSLAANILHAVTARQTVWLCLALIATATLAQSPRPEPANQIRHKTPQSRQTVSALLVSDIHFEPFWDPAKVAQLNAAPATTWRAILAKPPSPDQPQRFAALQQGCHVHGVDSSFALLDSSLKAMRSHADGAKFITVSGDLLSHAFDCKYSALLPKSTPGDYRAFVEKTIEYVVNELYAAFPGVPVFVALGNNDSDCGDYRLDAHSEFLRITGNEVTKNFPASERQAAADSFASGGYFSVSLPAPIENARLLVLDDLFMSKSYETCDGKADSSPADAQIAWLEQQLAEARANKQKVWVMGHIPPGIDLYATMKKTGDACGSQPNTFLSSEKMADVLAGFGDVVPLAIFAHTHMDELRLLKDEQAPSSSKAVAVKMVSSISPNHGNNPSFTLAQIDPTSATLVDYRVFAASNLTGIDAKWIKEYDFALRYYEPEFSASAVGRLIAGFAADPGAKSAASQAYIDDFSAGSPSLALQLFWPQYVCTLSNHTPESFKACVCPAAH